MHSKYTAKHMIDILFVLVLFALFTLSTVILIIFGANIYQSTVNHMHSNYISRTNVSYIIEKFRQADQYNGIAIGSIQDTPALTLMEDINGETYVTYIYAFEGKLYELFARKNLEMYPDGGQPILDVSSFSIEQTKPNLFYIHITTDDATDYSFYLTAHSAPQ